MYKFKSILFIGLLLIIISIAHYVEKYQHDVSIKNLENIINTYVENKTFVNAHGESFDSEDVDDVVRYYYSNALRLLNEKYGFSFKGWAINEKVDDDYVNVYFFDEDPLNALGGFKGNCTYTGHRNIIICDTNFALHKVANFDEFDENAKGEDRIILPYIRHVLLWVVGHEIGHIAHRHSGKHFNFGGQDWNKDNTKKTPNHALKEKEADEFAVEALGTWQIGHYLWMGLSQLAANPQDFGGKVNDDGTITVENNSLSHDPIFLRILEMAIMGIEKGLIMDSTGHFHRLRDRIVVTDKR